MAPLQPETSEVGCLIMALMVFRCMPAVGILPLFCDAALM